jgi:voltage-gated potassium channel
VDLTLAFLLTLEFVARAFAAEDRSRQLLSFTTFADLVVIASLLLPAFVDNLAFLRVVRALTLLRSYHLLRDLRADSSWFRLHEDIIQRTVNLAVFIFIVTSAVYVTQNDVNKDIATYVDALYFTITTLTTTGFGDITLPGTAGRLLSVIIMIFGVTLFFQLARAVLQPAKVRFKCPTCGLMRHDVDAVHCKACGELLNIPNDDLD